MKELTNNSCMCVCVYVMGSVIKNDLVNEQFNSVTFLSGDIHKKHRFLISERRIQIDDVATPSV